MVISPERLGIALYLQCSSILSLPYTLGECHMLVERALRRCADLRTYPHQCSLQYPLPSPAPVPSPPSASARAPVPSPTHSQTLAQSASQSASLSLILTSILTLSLSLTLRLRLRPRLSRSPTPRLRRTCRQPCSFQPSRGGTAAGAGADVAEARAEVGVRLRR